ncbi:cyclase family protein [Streptomyces sp. NPDC007100]|uniref:cyclase family protein n=1 Tax=Streptomyces sp. NPDC007100 TaxID=3155602 RepID=UPI0033E1215D
MISMRVLDLTHAFGPGQPREPEFDDEQRHREMTIERDGFDAVYHRIAGSWGTHVDAPAEMVAGGRTIDALPVEDLVLPLIVLDISQAVTDNPDRCLGRDDVLDWERRHGPVPAGCFAALRTDWSRRWPDIDAMRNVDSDGISHTPGWSLDALRYLLVERSVTAIGHETIDADPGMWTTADGPEGATAAENARRRYACEAYVLDHDHYQVELLTNLHALPPTGAHIVVGVGKARHGTAFPARVLALVP